MAKKKKNVYKKQQLVDLLTGLQDVQNLKGVELAVCSQKNTELIDNLLADIEVKARPPKDFVDLATAMQQFNMETEIEKVKANLFYCSNIKKKNYILRKKTRKYNYVL